MCYFNPSASPVVFNPLLFPRGVIFTFFAMVFSIRLASNAIFLSVQVISWKVKSTRRYLSLFPTSKKLSQSIWMFLMVMLLHWHCSYIIIYWFFLYVIYDKLVIFYAFVLRKARKMLKYSLIYVFLTQIISCLYEKFVDLQRDLETRMLNLKE